MPTLARSRVRRVLAAVMAGAVLTGCSLVGGGDDAAEESPAPAEQPNSTDGATEPAEAGGPVVLLTHDSFSLPKKLIKRFEEDSGVELDVRSSGDAGKLTTSLVLSQGNPEGDAAFGVDNTFASRALEAGVFDDLDVTLPAGAERFGLEGVDDGDDLAPVDTGAVCVNVDTAWFDAEGVPEPETLDDLRDPAYQDLFVIPGAPTSSPGMAFLLATVAEYGDDWPAYWEDLMANGAKITSGWTDAYTVDFTAGGGGGDRPIVVSYDSSPAFTVGEDGKSTTKALLDTCFRQVEYAGVLEGAENPDGARAVVEWLLTAEVQAALPTSMYVFPVVDGVELPTEWADFAQQPDATLEVDATEITANRQEWLTTWTDITSR